MRINLFFVFLFSAYFVDAQKRTEPESLEFKTFKLPKFPIADFPKKSIPISGIQVIQTLRDSIRFGYAMKGLDNHIVILVPEKPSTYFLQEGISKMYSSDFKPGGAHLLWVIKDLRLGEKISFNQYAYLRFNADAYITKDLVTYKPVCTIDTVFVNESGTDVTAWHGENIENAFRLLLKKTIQNGKTVLEQNTEGVSFEKIKENSNQQQDIPILNDQTYREGAYADFNEFLQNKPSITNFRIFSIGRKKEIKIVKISENNRVDTVNIWGLCKGGEIYKCNEKLLVSIEKQGNGFIISNYVEQVARRNNGIFISAFIGGLTGGLIVGLVSGSFVSSAGSDRILVKSIPYITKTKKQPEATCLDMKTGELTF